MHLNIKAHLKLPILRKCITVLAASYICNFSVARQIYCVWHDTYLRLLCWNNIDWVNYGLQLTSKVRYVSMPGGSAGGRQRVLYTCRSGLLLLKVQNTAFFPSHTHGSN